MENLGNNPSSYGLENHGLYNLRRAYWNMDPAALIEHAVQREEGHLASTGAFVALTGKYTGRSPKDKFVVREASSEKDIWWGSVNAPFSPADFDVLHARLDAYLQGRDVYVRDCFAGADPAYRLPIRIVTEYTWHNLFIRQLMIRATREEMKVHVPQFTIICAPNFQADPKADKTKSEAFIIINFAKGLVIIGGTCYAGEMKKSVFTILNYLLPHKGVLPMHCSANIGKDGDTALFFGLSGTGKTTLSADPARGLIGDDEHGWSDNGIFNFEGGCYAKVIKLRKENEPEIWEAIRFGSVLENVSMDPNSREVNYDSAEITENTRVGYPLNFIPNAVLPSVGGHPKNVVFLSCDAFGVLPPVARLSRDQAMYHFLSGYTAKVAGTERGLKEPTATFSTCFGSPFLPMDPSVYANLLGKKIDKHKSNIWLVNTGWTGGAYGEGSRMSIAHTRALLTAALSGKLDKVAYRKDPTFGFEVPVECPGVPAGVLDPRETWRDKNAYDAKARHLAGLFAENFKKYEATAGANVIAAGPKVS